MARKKSLLAPIIAITVSIGIGVFLISLINSDNTQAVPVPQPVTKIKEAPTVQILVASSDISIGKKIDFVDLSWRSWPESLLNPQYITQNEKPDYINNLIGGIAKLPIIAGEPIMEGKIVQPGDRGAMALLLRKGMRAVSVPISATTGAGGFILPGDYVDVIFTTGVIQQNLFDTENTDNKNKKPVLEKYLALKSLSKIEDNSDTDKKSTSDKSIKKIALNDNKETLDKSNSLKSDPKVRTKLLEYEKDEEKLVNKISKEDELLITNGNQVSELMLENVKVLAIDQTVTQSKPMNNQQKNQQNPAASQQATSILGATATLEVTPEQAKLLAWSSSSGTLTLSLRSFSENLSKQDNQKLSQKLPKTKTSFAFPIKNVLNNAPKEAPQPTTVSPPEPPLDENFEDTGLELIRNGNISFLRNSQKKNNYSDTSGEPDVQR